MSARGRGPGKVEERVPIRIPGEPAVLLEVGQDQLELLNGGHVPPDGVAFVERLGETEGGGSPTKAAPDIGPAVGPVVPGEDRGVGRFEAGGPARAVLQKGRKLTPGGEVRPCPDASYDQVERQSGRLGCSRSPVVDGIDRLDQVLIGDPLWLSRIFEP